MNYSKNDLVEFGKRLRDWGLIIPTDILDCAADEHLKEAHIDADCCKHEHKYNMADDVREYCPDCGKFLYGDEWDNDIALIGF